MNWILSWNEKRSSSIIPYSVHLVHPSHHWFLSYFCFFFFFLRIYSLRICTASFPMRCSPMSNFIYRKTSQTERLMLRSGVGKISWQELGMAASYRIMSFSRICLYLTRKYLLVKNEFLLSNVL